MPEIRFGVSYSRLHSVVPIPEFGRAAEDLGFDSVWTTEGLVNELAALDILMAIQEFAHHTKTITIGTCVLIVPLRNPAILAKQVATVDIISNGRVILGIGVGGSRNSNPAAFEVSGVALDERGARTDEALEIMTKLWTGEPVSHDGRFYRFDDIAMLPRPVRRPGPPIWSGGGTATGVLRRTARWCDGFVPTGVTPEDYGRLWQRIQRYCDEYQRDSTSLTKAIHLYVSLDEGSGQARHVAERTLTERYGHEVTLDNDRYAFGTAQDCVKVIERFVNVGITDFVFNVTRPLPEVMGQIERLGREVVPQFR